MREKAPPLCSPVSDVIPELLQPFCCYETSQTEDEAGKRTGEEAIPKGSSFGREFQEMVLKS